MVLFGKKKSVENVEKLDDKSLEPSKKTRSRKKEKPKPWGKRERILVFTVIVLTAGVSTVLSLSARAWKLPGLPRLAFPKMSVPFFGEETIIITRRVEQSAQVEQGKKAQKVTEEFKNKTKNLSGVYGLYVVNLDNGYFFGVNETETFQAASLIKLPVMVAVYLEAEEGNFDLNEKYTLKNSDKVGGAGSLSGKPAGYEITYRNLIRLMGKQSDNTAFKIVRNLLGDEKINKAIVKIGMKNTSLEENEMTPKDAGIFFEELWNARLSAPERSDGGQGNIVSKESAEELLDLLTDTLYEEWLAAGITDNVRVAHKYGREVHVVNDAGIVFADKPIVMVIMSKGVVEHEADAIFPELSRMIYEKWVD